MEFRDRTRPARVRLSAGIWILVAGVVSVSATTVLGGSGDWLGFRGDRGDGVAHNRGAFPDLESFGLTARWKRAIGSGYSGIAIANGHVVTMYSDGSNDVMVDLDAMTGNERWRFEIGPTYEGHDGSHTGPIATPLIKGDIVVGLGPKGRLFALELNAGRLLWSTELAKDHEVKDPFYGFGTSPIVLNNVLVVQTGKKDGAITGFELKTGKVLWSVGADSISYQAPIVGTVGGTKSVIAVGDKKLFAISAADGKMLWEYEHGGGGGRGALSLVPVLAGANRVLLALQDSGSRLIELSKTNGSTSFSPAWDSRAIRNSYNVPLYHEGHFYAYTSRFLTCVDANTGESVWKSRQPGDGFMILVDGHLVIVTKNGGVHVAKASPSGYEERASLAVFDDLAWTHPSFADGSIFVRSLDGIARIDVMDESAIAPVDEVVSETIAAGTTIGRFVERVGKSDNKEGMVEEFMSLQKEFPIIEAPDIVHFVYRGPGEDLAVAGDVFGARQERPMARVEGTDLFYYTARLDPAIRLNYMFMRDYKAMPDPRNPRKTVTTMVDEEMEMSFSGKELEMSWFAMPKWRAPTFLDEPSNKGRMESHELESEAMGNKHTIEVYVPTGYDKAISARYPVVYVHGGKSAMKYGELPRALDNLIGSRIDPILAVFVSASSFRSNDKYAAMLTDEVIPFVDKTYRTIANAESRASVGAGFGGVTAWYCALKNPGKIGKIGSQSMFLFDSFSPDVRGLLTSPGDQPLRIYMEWGSHDFRNPHEAWDLGESNEKFAAMLKTKGYDFEGGEITAGTGWSSWKNRTDRMLAALFPRN